MSRSEWLAKEVVYEGAIIRVSRGDVRLVNGDVRPFDIVEHDGGVAVVPLLDDHVLLVRQPRIVIGRDMLEIPAGKLEGPDDDIEERAQAELGEETGYRAGRLIPAAEFYVSPGYCSERITIFIGLDLEAVGAHPEPTEDISIVRLSLAEARRMLNERVFNDSKTIIGLRELFAYLDRQQAE